MTTKIELTQQEFKVQADHLYHLQSMFGLSSHLIGELAAEVSAEEISTATERYRDDGSLEGILASFLQARIEKAFEVVQFQQKDLFELAPIPEHLQETPKESNA